MIPPSLEYYSFLLTAFMTGDDDAMDTIITINFVP